MMMPCPLAALDLPNNAGAPGTIQAVLRSNLGGKPESIRLRFWAARPAPSLSSGNSLLSADLIALEDN